MAVQDEGRASDCVRVAAAGPSTARHLHSPRAHSLETAQRPRTNPRRTAIGVLPAPRPRRLHPDSTLLPHTGRRAPTGAESALLSEATRVPLVSEDTWTRPEGALLPFPLTAEKQRHLSAPRRSRRRGPAPCPGGGCREPPPPATVRTFPTAVSSAGRAGTFW